MKIGTEGTFVFNKNHGFITTASQRESNLFRTRCYLVGHMQYADGRDWRDYVSTEMEAMGITVFNPYDKPFVKDVDEDEEAREKILKDMENGHYNDVAKRMKQIRSYDLNLVDRSDFIIAHLLPEVASWGSAEELVTAVRMKKPVFVSMEGGKKKTPLWVMGMMPHHYIYDSVEDIVDMLKRINSGDKEIDSDRWRLLRKELR
tara:strand:+ start:6730 stop:7338 length:609 start_codon:yes stop_codon:yes gene_type:complete